MVVRNEDVGDLRRLDAGRSQGRGKLSCHRKARRSGTSIEQQDSAVSAPYEQRLDAQMQFVDGKAGTCQHGIDRRSRLAQAKRRAVVRDAEVAVAQGHGVERAYSESMHIGIGAVSRRHSGACSGPTVSGACEQAVASKSAMKAAAAMFMSELA